MPVNKHIAHQKVIGLPIAIPETVLRRFPHLREELASKALEDEVFLSLCHEYSSLVRTVKSSGAEHSADREELTILKDALELEILERLSRSSVPDRGLNI